jgi:hypothetical protein
LGQNPKYSMKTWTIFAVLCIKCRISPLLSLILDYWWCWHGGCRFLKSLWCRCKTLTIAPIPQILKEHAQLLFSLMHWKVEFGSPWCCLSLLVRIVSIVLCRLDPQSDMSAANMPTCRQHVVRCVGDMSNVMTCPKQHQKTSVPMR